MKKTTEQKKKKVHIIATPTIRLHTKAQNKDKHKRLMNIVKHKIQR